MLQIKQRIRLTIEDINYEGKGVARVDNMVIFVDNALPGEVVDAKIDRVTKKYSFAHATSIIKASCDREENPIWFGGCELVHIKYSIGCEFKRKTFESTLKRIGNIDKKVDDFKEAKHPYQYRNKITIPVGVDSEGKIKVGYYKRGTHKIIPFDKCMLASDKVNELIFHLKDVFDSLYIKGYREEEGKGVVKHLIIRESNLNQIMLIIVTNKKPLKESFVLVRKIKEKFPEVVSIINNVSKSINNVVLGDKSYILMGKDELREKVGDTEYIISHRSFFQTNKEQTEVLYDAIKNNLHGKKNKVLDCYCGVGSISLYLKDKCTSVLGIEVVEDAVTLANVNSKINNSEEFEYKVGRVEDNIRGALRNNIDCIILDPPRKGLDDIVRSAIIDSNVKQVIYVSCNPSSLARDLGILKDYYNIDRIDLVDMFCYTTGIEAVINLSRK